MRPPTLPLRLRRAVAVASAVAAALIGPLAASADGDRFRVIVNEDCAAGELTREQVSRLFLGKVTEWPDGKHVEPVDQREGSPVREAFTRAVHRRSIAGIKVHWQQAIFSGRAVPPLEVSGDAAVLAHVRDHPGGIGYVSASAQLEGVRVVAVKD